MSRTTAHLPVHGTTRHDHDGLLLVLDQRLDGHDTFLSGRLDLGHGPAAVRIITLDDITVLRPMEAIEAPAPSWTGTLHLPHGLRPGSVPRDLAAAAETDRRDLGALDAAEMRYALTFLNEATTEQIRAARVTAIVSALPTTEGATA